MSTQEIIQLIVALTPLGLAALGLLQAGRATRKVEQISQRTDVVEQTTQKNTDVATEARSTASQTLAMISLMQTQADNQSNTTAVLKEMLDHMASADAKQSAERESFNTSIDKLASAVEAMTSAITLNNNLTVEIKTGLDGLPDTIEKAHTDFMTEVVKHMADTLDPRDHELQRELANINARLDKVLEMVQQLIAAGASARPETPPTPTESPAAQPSPEKES